jgi:RNA polymerase sigma-70 factor (ECF subfamily)
VIIPSDESNIIKAVKKAIDGDVEAFGWLYRFYVDRIYRYVFSQVGDKMTAEDVTEEVFLKTWKSIGSCRGKEQTFTAWLYRIAHNHLVDNIRKYRREVSLDKVTLTDKSDPEKEAEDNMELQKVLEAVHSLPEPQKQVILLKFIEDIDNDEICRILGKRHGAVRALQMRALINLRDKFNCGVGSDGR